MDSSLAGLLFFFICVLLIVFGFVEGFIFVALGVNYFIVGLVVAYIGRDVDEVGFLLMLVLGIVGVIVWELKCAHADIEETYAPRVRMRRLYQKGYQCGDCFWFGKLGCKRNEKLKNAEPCEDYKRAQWME